MNFKIVLIGSDRVVLDEISRQLATSGNVSSYLVDRVLYHSPPPGLDALFLILPAAERWGAQPIEGRAQVLSVGAEDQQKGMPRHVVTGVVLRPSDERGAIPETKLLVTTALEAVRQFNTSSEDKINRLGFWVADLTKGVSVGQLSKILGEALQESAL